MKNILESQKIPKVFFGGRVDSHLLNRGFYVSLQGVTHIQLIEQASRCSLSSSKKCLNGLTKCVEVDSDAIGPAVAQEWKAAREEAH